MANFDFPKLERILNILIYMYALTSPIYFMRLGTNIVPSDFIGGAIILTWLFHKLSTKSQIYFHRIFIIPLTLSLFSIISTTYATYPFESLPSGLLLLNLSVISIIVFDFILTDKNPFIHINRLLVLWIVGVLMTTLAIFYLEFLDVGYRAFRPSYSYNHRTQLPYFLVVTVIYSTYLYIIKYDSRSLLGTMSYFIVYQFSVFILFISISRGPWIATIGVLFIASLLDQKVRKKVFILTTPGLLIGIYSAIYYNQLDRMINRFLSIFRPTDSETSGRVDIYTHAIQTAIENRFFGIGWNNYSIIYDIGGSAHSTYLTIASELGMIALIMYLFIPTTLFVYYIKMNFNEIQNNKEYRISLASIAGVLGLFIGQIFSTAILWFRGFWFILAIAIATLMLNNRQ